MLLSLIALARTIRQTNHKNQFTKVQYILFLLRVEKLVPGGRGYNNWKQIQAFGIALPTHRLPGLWGASDKSPTNQHHAPRFRLAQFSPPPPTTANGSRFFGSRFASTRARQPYPLTQGTHTTQYPPHHTCTPAHAKPGIACMYG